MAQAPPGIRVFPWVLLALPCALLGCEERVGSGAPGAATTSGPVVEPHPNASASAGHAAPLDINVAPETGVLEPPKLEGAPKIVGDSKGGKGQPSLR